MDVQLVPKTVLPSTPQASPQHVPASGADASAASKPILAGSGQSVSVVAEVSGTVDRQQDRIGRQSEESATPQQVIDSLRLTNRRTQLDFDRELEIVVLQVVDTRTEEVIETIPPEELIRQLREAIRPDPPSRFGDNAGGLVIATDQSTARAYAEILERVCGERVTVVLSDEKEASARIEEFSEGTSRWMVAVRMVSEGVDVPRLAVGVYATSSSTPLEEHVRGSLSCNLGAGSRSRR